MFTYLVATSDSLGMAKDVMAAKPMVLLRERQFIALGFGGSRDPQRLSA